MCSHLDCGGHLLDKWPGTKLKCAHKIKKEKTKGCKTMEISGKYAEKLNNKVTEALALVGDRKVVSVTGQQMERCLESYPCCGHGGAKILLKSGEIVYLDASSVEIGAIQKTLAPQQKKSHFAEYVVNWEYEK